MLSYILLFILATPAQPAETAQVQELIERRSHLLGHPMHANGAQALAISALEERGSISLPVILAVIEIESKYDARAKSKKKCKGLMQLSPATAKTMAKRLGMSSYHAFSAHDNLKLGVNYLAALLQENGSVGKALTIYNMGWHNFVKHGKKVSSYAKLVLKRSTIIKRYLENGLTCEK